MILTLLISFTLDFLFGEPPEIIHPVVWIGSIIQLSNDKINITNEKVKGFFIVTVSLIFSFIFCFFLYFISNYCMTSSILVLLLNAYFLKCTFSIRYMISPAIKMYFMLISKNIDEINFNDLNIYVSRDIKSLNKEQVISCIIESISENYVDSVLSPLFYYFIFGPFGIFGAYLFKTINTLDSMIGYKTKRYINIGYIAAKLDDILNYIPSRFSIFFLFLGSIILKLKYPQLNPLNGFKTAIRDHDKTESPNSGWPMAMMAGILSKKLEKKDEYVLGCDFECLNPYDIIKTCLIFILTSTITLFLLISSLFYL